MSDRSPYKHIDDRPPMFLALPSGCWLWLRAVNQFGYGRWHARGDDYRRAAHRVVWETLNGPVPDGCELDHLCGFESCVNPGHLEAVPAQVNKYRRNRANGWRGNGRGSTAPIDDPESYTWSEGDSENAEPAPSSLPDEAVPF